MSLVLLMICDFLVRILGRHLHRRDVGRLALASRESFRYGRRLLAVGPNGWSMAHELVGWRMAYARDPLIMLLLFYNGPWRGTDGHTYWSIENARPQAYQPEEEPEPFSTTTSRCFRVYADDLRQ